MESMLSNHHGTLVTLNLQTGTSYLPPSDKFSSLRGLSRSGTGENNLAFKCTRKRLVVETLHLDVEGGVGERRTRHGAGTESVTKDPIITAAMTSNLTVELECENNVAELSIGSSVKKCGVSERKKEVSFQVDQPDLYDF